jgi:hypothetical protein
MKQSVIIVVFLAFLISASSAFAQGSLRVVGLSDNSSFYPNSSVPKYARLEITFTVEGTVARNFYLPFDPNPPSGLVVGEGISVDAELTPDNWNTIYTQPAFYYQEFEDQLKNSREWFYPTGNFYWKVRFAPNKAGNWRYRIRVRDARSEIVSEEHSFLVSESSNKGFIRVSQVDKRYFEYEDGSYFPALGYNMNYNHVSWVNPVLDNRTNFEKMRESGINFVRIWLSQWSIFGSHWNPWKSFTNHGGDPPLEMLSSLASEFSDGEHDVSLVVSKTTPGECVFFGSGTAPIAVKPNTRYRVRVKYWATDLAGGGGFVVKYGPWVGCSGAVSITPVVSQNSSSWRWLEGEFTTANVNYIDHIYLALENVTSGRVRIVEVHLNEVKSDGTLGVDVIQKPDMDHHKYFDQRNSYAFDKVVKLAEENGIYLRPVTLDHREWIFNHTNFQGLPTGDFGCTDPSIPSTCPSPSYLYGPTDRSISKNRWLQMAWWRYLQARWGYSPNIHSWEYVNEGTPGTEHAVAADIMGRYFDQFVANKHMVSTSRWSGSTGQWNLSQYPGIDYADIHFYIMKQSNPDFFDEAQAVITASSNWGASQSLSRWPVVRGETGFVGGDTNSPNMDIRRDVNGVWLHNYLWAALNSNALIEQYWYEGYHIYDCPSPPGGCRLTFDHRGKFRPFYDFVSNIPLNKGGYVSADAHGFDSSYIRVVGQKNPQSVKAHLWVQNKRHTWCAVVGGVSGCPSSWDGSRLNGTIAIGGFPAGVSMPVEYWFFDNLTNLTKQTSTLTVGQDGEIVINLSSFPPNVVDAGIKIGVYDSGSIGRGDANADGRVDGIDYIIWSNHFGQSTASGSRDGDFDGSGSVDNMDFRVWMEGYGN